MTTTPDVRPDDPDRPLAVTPVPVRVVTPEQVAQAVLQLRERRGQAPAEQMCAVLRALDLTVLPASASTAADLAVRSAV